MIRVPFASRAPIVSTLLTPKVHQQGPLLGTLLAVGWVMGVSGRLDVRSYDGQIKHEYRNGHCEDQGRGPVSEPDPAEAGRLADVVGIGGAERTRHDVRAPERDHGVQTELPPRHSGDQDEHTKEDARSQIPQVESGRGEVPESCPQGKCGKHCCPVEALAPCVVMLWMESVPSVRCHTRKMTPNTTAHRAVVPA